MTMADGNILILGGGQQVGSPEAAVTALAVFYDGPLN